MVESVLIQFKEYKLHIKWPVEAQTFSPSSEMHCWDVGLSLTEAEIVSTLFQLEVWSLCDGLLFLSVSSSGLPFYIVIIMVYQT